MNERMNECMAGRMDGRITQSFEVSDYLAAKLITQFTVCNYSNKRVPDTYVAVRVAAVGKNERLASPFTQPSERENEKYQGKVGPITDPTLPWVGLRVKGGVGGHVSSRLCR